MPLRILLVCFLLSACSAQLRTQELYPYAYPTPRFDGPRTDVGLYLDRRWKT